MSTLVYVLLLAAGRGERFGAAENKCFARLGGKPVLWHAYRAFALHARIDGIAVLTATGEQARAEAILHDQIDGRFLGFVRGGATRQRSVLAGLNHLQRGGVKDVPLVLVHDAARCLVSAGIIDRTIDLALGAYAGVAPALPLSDTVRLVDSSGRVDACLDRTLLRAMQTPQAARLDVLRSAYEQCRRQGLDLTDDLSALEAVGYPVRLIAGEPRNMKITTPEDLVLASVWLEHEE